MSRTRTRDPGSTRARPESSPIGQRDQAPPDSARRRELLPPALDGDSKVECRRRYLCQRRSDLGAPSSARGTRRTVFNGFNLRLTSSSIEMPTVRSESQSRRVCWSVSAAMDSGDAAAV